MSAAPRLAVVGSGPSGLMAAHVAAKGIASHRHAVTVFERRPGLGRKLLIAGASGLNISHDAPIEEFIEFYRERDPEVDPRLLQAVRDFPPEAWIDFVKSLGHEVFVGTSRRWFVREMKASGLLSSWTLALKNLGVKFETAQELTGLTRLESGGIQLAFGSRRATFDRVILALGGGSWEERLPLWPEILRGYDIEVRPFEPSNVGYELDFPSALLKEAEGKPIKNCTLTTGLGSKQGELILTRYGLEGTPMYFVGTRGRATLCMRPDLSLNEWMALLRRPTAENLSPMRKLTKLGGLSEAALAMVYHLTPTAIRGNLTQLGLRVHAFPLELKNPRSLEEAISSRGGILWNELDSSLMLKKIPGVYACGEMIDWDAPTGGFLIQAAVALGRKAGLA